MKRYKVSLIAGITGVFYGALALLFNYHMVPALFPGYDILAAPGRFALSFVSKETAFEPKLVLFLFGQLLGFIVFYFLSVMLWHGVNMLIKGKIVEDN